MLRTWPFTRTSPLYMQHTEESRAQNTVCSHRSCCQVNEKRKKQKGPFDPKRDTFKLCHSICSNSNLSELLHIHIQNRRVGANIHCKLEGYHSLMWIWCGWEQCDNRPLFQDKGHHFLSTRKLVFLPWKESQSTTVSYSLCLVWPSKPNRAQLISLRYLIHSLSSKKDTRQPTPKKTETYLAYLEHPSHHQPKKNDSSTKSLHFWVR